MRLPAILLAAGLLLAPAAHAGKLYKWVDSQGNVSYQDRPPPDGAKGVQERTVKGVDESQEGDDTTRAPVTLYAIPKCSSCDAARAYLKKRNVAFTEKNVESDPKAQAELKAKSGGLAVPTIIVGKTVMKGYMESWLGGELDKAGYPKAKPAEGASPQPAQ